MVQGQWGHLYCIAMGMCFFMHLFVSAVVPLVSQTTCSELVACCMRMWGEIRFQSDVGDKNAWADDALDCFTRLQYCMNAISDDCHSGLTRENIEYIAHLIDCISIEVDDAIQVSGSEREKKEFLILLASLWIQLRSIMLEL